ncbi:MAG: hypothetical protein ACXWZ6_08790 [Solirubrobacterales bacterium]
MTLARKLALRALLAALGAALVAPGPAAASDGLVRALAASECSELKQDLGRKAFRKRFGRKPMRACVKRGRPAARRAVAAATTECRAELDGWGLDLFLEDWSSFEECVASYAQWALDGGLADDEGDEGDGDPEDDEDPEER